MTDSHGYDDFARCLGRYNPDTNSYNDGAVNQKLAEIKGYAEGTRQPRHPGATIIILVDKYSRDRQALRVAATLAWRGVLRDYSGPVPQYVRDLLNSEGR